MVIMSYNILLVDDDCDFREELRSCLEDDYKILEAANGQQAMQFLKKPNMIDIVILDVIMQGLSGTEVLKEIKKNAPDLGIIMMSGKSSKEAAIESLRSHADDFIEKPFSIPVLKEAITRILKAGSRRRFPHLSDAGKMERAKLFIERNYDRKIRLDDIADEVCLSPKYISRAFKEHVGCGFNEYRLKIKMEYAQAKLKESGATIEQIARDFGYQNTESFTRVFKKITGLSPSEFRACKITRTRS